MLYVESLNTAIHQLMSNDKSVILIGEDLLDPYGGAFKVSKGLSTTYPDQVISSPISEGAILGSAIGMAMGGLKPIVEIMFGDFLALAADQIINHATKYHWMFNEKVNVPVVIRTPMGAGRGYGPTHSQSLESIFMSVSGLTICAPSIYHDPGNLLTQCVLNVDHPVIFIENKGSYSKKLKLLQSDMGHHLHRVSLVTDGINETLLLSLFPDERAEIIIVTYGGMAEIAVDAAVEIFLEEEILIHVVVCSMIKPISIDSLLSLFCKTGRVLVLEEGNKIGGWGAEVASQVQYEVFDKLSQPVFRLGAEDMPIPAALPLEKEVLPTKDKIVGVVLGMMQREA